MWSFYLNGGANAVIKNLCRDGFQYQTASGSLTTWHTTKKEDGYLEGHFLSADETINSRQSVHWHEEEIDKVSYYSSDNENPYLTYACHRVNLDTVDVMREWSGKKVNYQVIVVSRNEERQVTHYRCLIPEKTWEIVLTYDAVGHIVREDMSALEETEQKIE